jgi:hypothetical protein
VTVPHRSPTVPREGSFDRSPPFPTLKGERERGTDVGTLPARDRSPSSKGMEANARRLLVTGSVAVLEASADHVLARVVGDHGAYTVEYDDCWHCTCPVFGPCSHAIAVARVTVVTGAVRPDTGHGAGGVGGWVADVWMPRAALDSAGPGKKVRRVMAPIGIGGWVDHGFFGWSSTGLSLTARAKFRNFRHGSTEPALTCGCGGFPRA